MESKFPLKTLAYACLLLAAPLVANAAGLGKLTVNSYLGQPLRAEIDLVAVQKDELDSVAARIASIEAFNQAHIDRAGILSSIKVSVEHRPGGEPYVKLTSVQPVNDPFLDMLIQLDWSSGRLVREYTVLLDPPGFSEKETVAPVEAPTVRMPKAAAPTAMAPKAEAMPPVEHKAMAAPATGKAKGISKKPSATKQAAQPKAAPSLAEQTFPKFIGNREVMPAPVPPKPENYEVQKGDTLAKIAGEVKPEGYSLDQMLVALYNANKDAFAGNMNRLKTGKILRIPEEQAIGEMNQSAATKVVRAQAADWNAYRQKLASAVAEAKPAEQTTEQQVATGKITTAIEEKGAPKEVPTDVLKLSKGEAPGAGKGAGAGGEKGIKALQDRIQAMQEEATAKDKTVAEANSRIAALQKNIADMQNLLDIRNKEMADLQKQVQGKAAPAATPTPAAPVAEAPQAAPVPAQPEVTPLVKAVPEPVVPPKPETKPAPKKPVAPPPMTVEPGFMDTIMGNPVYMGGGALAVVGALVAALWAIGKRRRKALASFEDSIMTGGDLKTNTVFGNTAGGTIDTGDTSFLTDFSQAGMGAIDTNDVDPIAEAEVYMAYGRDAQAEEILKEAMSKDPNRHEIQLKLLEIYAGRKNVTAFETLAAELYAATSGNGPIWDKAAELGRALDAQNPLYGGLGAQSGGGEIAVPELSVESNTPEVAPTPAVESLEPEIGAEEPAELEETSAMDLSLDMDTLAGPMDEVEEPAEMHEMIEAETPLDFSLEEPAISEAAEAEVAGKPEEGMLEFNLDTIMPEAAQAEAAEQLAETEEKAETDTLQFETTLSEAPTISEAPTLDLTSEHAQEGAEEITVEAPAEEDIGLDFDFNLDKELEASTPAEETSESHELIPDLDLGGINLNLDETPTVSFEAADTVAGGDQKWEESATKLDLAKAYVEMGDKEGAREILQEVLEEGGPEQKDSAQKLMATL